MRIARFDFYIIILSQSLCTAPLLLKTKDFAVILNLWNYTRRSLFKILMAGLKYMQRQAWQTTPIPSKRVWFAILKWLLHRQRRWQWMECCKLQTTSPRVRQCVYVYYSIRYCPYCPESESLLETHYNELLRMIEEIGRGVKPSYTNSKSSTDRLKKSKPTLLL